MISKQWKNLKLQNQLLIIQTSIVAIIFVILISSCMYLIQLFSIFIEQQLLQQLVLNSMVSAIQTAVIRVDSLGMVEYNLFLAEGKVLQNLYNFQADNDVKMYSQLEDCLQKPHSKQFYSYQICYGIYGQDDNESDYTQILDAIALQNQFVPFISRKQIITYYNIKFGKEILLSQYQGKFIKHPDDQLLDALNYMEQSQAPNYFQQQLNLTGQVFLALSAVRNDLYMGVLLNQSENPYYSLINSEQYFNQRSLSVLDSGLILSDTNNDFAFGLQFQNTSISGFNIEQFQIIKNFANKTDAIIKNECQFQFKNDVLCLINIHGQQQLVFSKYLVTSRFYVIVIVDTIFLNQIEDDFNQQLYLLIHDLLIKIGIQYLIAFIICVIVQIAFIKKLNRPIEDLQRAAKLHINKYQHTLQKIISSHQTQNQTQKLADAFFNLINLNERNNTNHKKQLQFSQDLEFKESKGAILRRQSKKIVLQIRKHIWNHIHKQYGLSRQQI